jgi:hypothetical protein
MLSSLYSTCSKKTLPADCLRSLRIQVCPPEEFQHIFWEDPQLRELVKEVFPQCLEMRHGRGSELGMEKELTENENWGVPGMGVPPNGWFVFAKIHL